MEQMQEQTEWVRRRFKRCPKCGSAEIVSATVPTPFETDMVWGIQCPSCGYDDNSVEEPPFIPHPVDQIKPE